jgi:hypothetical protein
MPSPHRATRFASDEGPGLTVVVLKRARKDKDR